MKTAAVIAEYNPFHRGHEYQLRRIRDDSGADFIVVLMSGDFVQRGAPAVLDKYSRTGMALAEGADLVLELPLAAAIGSARDFAATGVFVLDRLGIVDELWFGSESGDTDFLSEIARVTADEPELYRSTLRERLASGDTYPAAQSRAVTAVLSGSEKEAAVQSILSSPNDLLAVSYLTALYRRESRIVPVALRREGGDHHTPDAGTVSFSAEAVRRDLFAGRYDRVRLAVPDVTARRLTSAADRNELLCADDFSDMILYRVRQMRREELLETAGVSEDLANRMEKLRFSCPTAGTFAEALKTKNITRTRIDRVLFSALLGVRKGDASRAAERPYVTVLGMREGAGRLLSEIARKGSVRLSVGAGEKSGPDYAADLFASNLYESVRAGRSHTQFHHELTRNVVKL